MQDIAHVYQCAVIMSEGGSIWELYHGCYLGYKPNQDINEIYTPPIEKTDWSEHTSHGTRRIIVQNPYMYVPLLI